MEVVEIARSGVIPDALDSALRTALNGAISGISTGKGMVQVWFFTTPTPAQQTSVASIVAAHDPAFLSVDNGETI
jgi:hypothetical protein